MYPNDATLLATGGVGILVTSTWKVIVAEPPAGMLLIGIPVEGLPAVGVPLTVTLFGTKVVPAGIGVCKCNVLGRKCSGILDNDCIG